MSSKGFCSTEMPCVLYMCRVLSFCRYHELRALLCCGDVCGKLAGDYNTRTQLTQQLHIVKGQWGTGQEVRKLLTVELVMQ